MHTEIAIGSRMMRRVLLFAAVSRLFLALGLVLSASSGLLIFEVVPSFQEFFHSVGIELPQVTIWLLRFYPIFLALPLLVLAVWFVWPTPGQRGLASLIAGVAILAVIPSLIALAMYAPILRMGS